MSIRHVIYTQVPGVDGTGITTIEKEQILLDVEDAKQMAENVGTDTPGETADQLRVSVSGPRWLPPDSVSPLLFDAAGDGVTDDYAAIMQAYDALGPGGGKIDLGGRQFYSGQTITWGSDKAVSIDGGARNTVGSVPRGGGFVFPDTGIDGIVIETRVAPRLVNFGIRVAGVTSSRSAGTGNGLTIKTQKAHLDSITVTGFGGHGYYILSAPVAPSGVNANHGYMNQCDANYNGQHGVFFDGSDSQVWTVINANLIYNGGYGILNSARYQNTFITPHEYGCVEGAYYDESWNGFWINPYSEGPSFFDIGADSSGGVLLMAHYSAPNVRWRPTPTDVNAYDFNARPGGSPTTTARNAIETRRWKIEGDGEVWTSIKQRGHLSNRRWSLYPDAPSVGAYELREEELGTILTAYGNSAAQRTLRVDAARLGFYGQAGIDKPTVSGSKGGNAALASLITALANLGLINDSTS